MVKCAMKSIYSTGQQCGYPPALLYEAIQDENTELCFIFCSARSVLFFPLYSGTSLKGLSKLRTQYKNLPIKDKFCSPNGTMLICFYLWKRKTSIWQQKWPRNGWPQSVHYKEVPL